MPPVAPAANGVASPAPVGMPPAAGGVPPVQASTPPQAAPAATAVRWSAEMLQSLRLQAFEQLVAQLARQVQASPGAPPPQWPASGVSETLAKVLQALLEQVATQQGRTLQLLASQPGSAALMQALAASAKGEAPASATAAKNPTAPTSAQGTPPAPPQGPAQTGQQPAAPAPAIAAQAPAARPALPAAALAQAAIATAAVADLAPSAVAVQGPPAVAGLAAAAPQFSAAAPAAAASSAPPALPARALPALQTWWVQQGVLMTAQGERGFTLSLQVPQAWAQAQGAALAQVAPLPPAPAGGAAPAALAAGLPPGLSATGAGVRLPPELPLQALASGPVAIVVQPRDEPGLRTSALLLLELQPLRQAGAPVAPAGPFVALPPAMAQEMQQLLQNRGDPWLQMAVAQNAGALPRERSGHQSHLCTTAGCQYEGRAPCVQPFCSEMNRLWGVARAERRL